MDAAGVAGSIWNKPSHADSRRAGSEREASLRLTELVAKLEQERDALAAHVERQSSCCARVSACATTRWMPTRTIHHRATGR